MYQKTKPSIGKKMQQDHSRAQRSTAKKIYTQLIKMT